MVKNTINKDWSNYILKQKEKKVPLENLEKILIRENYSMDIIYNLLYKNNENKKEDKNKLLKKNLGKIELYKDPNIYVINNFISDEECDHFIKLGSKNLKRAMVSGDSKGMISTGRTGSNNWIRHDFDKITRKVSKKISELVGIPIENAESFQIIHYDKNQEYRNHYDGWEHNKSEKTLRNMKYGGQRLLTCLCYLNDVEEGGGTKFTKLNLTVKAKKGRIVVFKNVLENSNIRHPKSEHAGMPVMKGEKYAFNLWFRECDRKKLYKDFNKSYYYDMK